MRKFLIKAVTLLAFAGFYSPANAAVVGLQYVGTVTNCPLGACTLLGAAGGELVLNFDLTFSGAGLINDPAAISNVDIAINTLSGGVLGFVNGIGTSANFVVDASGFPQSGTLGLQATGATTGLVIDAIVNLGPSDLVSPLTGTILAPGEWEGSSFDSTLMTNVIVAGGTGAFVPVPAAVWLFGSALGLLGWVRRKAA